MKKANGSSYEGQRIYTPALLKVYDLWVLGISNSFIWKCPTRKMVDFYNQNITGNHLDVGVGTGYYLDHCTFPHPQPKVVLADMNRNSLKASADRIRRYKPSTAEFDVLKPFSLSQAPFDSIGIQYLLHCLPGTMNDKEKVFINLKTHLSQSGVIFGATLLGQGLKRSKTAERLMAFYNSKKVFSNENDSLNSLEDILHRNFKRVSIQTEGCVAFFAVRK